MTELEYLEVERLAGGQARLRQLLATLAQLHEASSIDPTAPPIETLVPSRHPDHDPTNCLTDDDGTYLFIRRIHKRNRLYEITFGACYGSTCGQGDTFLFKFSKNQWHFREHLSSHIH